jgi:sn-glycerol 3-phosphate transport system permease protein
MALLTLGERRNARPRLAGPRAVRSLGLAAILLAPSLFCLALFTYGPVLVVAAQSLMQTRRGEHGWGLANYARLFSDAHFQTALGNNALYALGTIAPSIGLALAFALALQKNSRVTTVLRTILVAPLLIPLVAASALFAFIYLPGGGLIDYYFARGASHNWLGSPSTALAAVIVVTIWKNAGYYMLFFLAGLSAIPDDLIDAARLDGAGAWRRLRHVILPLLGPTFAFVLPIALLNALTQIDHVVTLTQGGPDDSTNLLLFYIYQQAVQNNDSGLAAAATVISVAALLALALIARRTLEGGVHYES